LRDLPAHHSLVFTPRILASILAGFQRGLCFVHDDYYYSSATSTLQTAGDLQSSQPHSRA
jgi:hypothetical protein